MNQILSHSSLHLYTHACTHTHTLARAHVSHTHKGIPFTGNIPLMKENRPRRFDSVLSRSLFFVCGSNQGRAQGQGQST